MICPKCGYEHHDNAACSAPATAAVVIQQVLMAVVGIVILLTLILNIPGINPVPVGSVKFRMVPRDVQQLRDDNSICLDNQRRIVTAILVYAQDHEGILPTRDIVWKELKLPDVVLRCPKAPRLNNGYGLNQAIAGQSMYDIIDKPHALVSADCGTGSGALTSMNDIDMRRHDNNYIASFADSHVELLQQGITADGATAGLMITLRLPGGGTATTTAPLPADAARGPQEQALKAALVNMRTAVKQFQSDTGAFPLLLEDLVAPDNTRLNANFNNDARARYRGPYLTGTGGINGSALPANPFATTAVVGSHWSYDPTTGMVKSAVTGMTLDGINYADL